MISGIDEKRLLKKYLVKVRLFPGASADDTHHYLRLLLQKWTDTIISHVGTNNCENESSPVVLDKMLNLKTSISKFSTQCKIRISNVINRTDDDKASLTVKNLNNHFNSLDLDVMDKSNIGKECLGKKCLHLIEKMAVQMKFCFIWTWKNMNRLAIGHLKIIS